MFLAITLVLGDGKQLGHSIIFFITLLEVYSSIEQHRNHSLSKWDMCFTW